MKEINCINCMKMISEETEICPHCGYNQKLEQSYFCLKPHTILMGRYLVGRLLGQGGFGMTYVGYDLKLLNKVAIKEYYPAGNVTRNNTVTNKVEWNTSRMDSSQWQKGCDSFLKEARRMEQVNSYSNIVRVRDTFTTNGTAYIIMDYIEGETLKQRLVRSGKMTYKDCMELLKPLMKSLVKMHQKGLIHRDISPDNIMIREDGTACLLDFGAAKDISFEQNSSSQQITKKGFSPLEQYQEGGSIGPWTDVYALCATIYYCVTGKLVPDAMDRIVTDKLKLDPEFSSIAGEMAEAAVREGLCVVPSGRIQSVETLLDRLPDDKEPVVDTGGSSGGTESNGSGSSGSNNNDNKNKKKTWIISLVAAAVVLLAGVGIYVKTHTGNDSSGVTAENTLAGEMQESTVITTETDTVPVSGLDASEEAELKAATKTSEKTAAGEDKGQSENVLMKDDNFEIVEEGVYPGKVLGSDIDRDRIVSVEFLNTLEAMPDTAWDASWKQDQSVMAWTETAAGSGERYRLYIAGDGGVTGRDCYGLFLGYCNAESIQFNGCFDTSDVEDFSYMFTFCQNVSEFDLSTLDTGSASTMRCMFNGCGKATELDLGNFDTSAVNNTTYMFYKCTNLKKINLSSFHTGEVTDMGGMFYGCENLGSLDLSSFDTRKTTNMSQMFDGCNNLLEVNVKSFDTSSVTEMRSMFAGCHNLKTIDVSSFNTSNVKDFGIMFYQCESLEELDVSGFDTASATAMGWMFSDCKSLKKLDVSNFNTANVTNMECMFNHCVKLEELDLSSFDTGKVENMQYMFRECGFTELDLSSFKTGNVTNMECMFGECSNLARLDLSSFDTGRVTNMAWMFYNCKNLEKLNAGSFDTSAVTQIYSMFNGCENLTELDLSSFDTKAVADMSYMFNGCTNLKTLQINTDNFTAGSDTNTENMFTGCGITAKEAGLKF